MFSPQTLAHIKKIDLVLRLIWLSMIGSIAVLVVVAFQSSPVEGKDMAGLSPILNIFAIVLAAASLSLRRFMLSENRLLRTLSRPVDLKAMAAIEGRLNEEHLGKLEQLPTHERPLLLLSRAIFTTTVIQLSLHESIAVLGFVLSFGTADPAAILPFASAALALNILAFPNIGKTTERFAGALCRTAR